MATGDTQQGNNSTIKYVDLDGLSHFKAKLDNLYVEKQTGKGLSTNDYTTEEKNKLNGIEAGAEENVIENIVINGTTATISNKTATINMTSGAIDSISVNGIAQQIVNKNVDISVPTKTSDLTNDDNVVKDASYVHTDNNFTATEKNKLSGVASGAQVNVIESIKVNGTAQAITSKAVDITVPTNNNQLTNGAGYQTASQVETAINNKIGSTYKAKGSVSNVSNLPTLGSANEGNVYNMTSSFVTTADFVEGAGKSYPAGTNVVCINNGTTASPSYKWDILSGFVDLSLYVLASQLVPYTNSEIDTIFA